LKRLEGQTLKHRHGGRPRSLVLGKLLYWGAVNNYDISPDGQRFVMIKESEEQQEARQINVVLNWFEELKRLVPTP